MDPSPSPTFSDTDRVSRAAKERRLCQRGHVLWLYGLSGSGKSTLATRLEDRLAGRGFATLRLDGDEVRNGLNRGLGFSDDDRTENLRRAGEVARLTARAGLVTLCAFITPRRAQRAMLREIIGPDDLSIVHLAASFAACAHRDPKGLYARAAARDLTQFTGVDSSFEQPLPGEDALAIDTEAVSPEPCVERLLGLVLPLITLRDAKL